MTSFSELLKRAWNTVFREERAFFAIFGVGFALNVLSLVYNLVVGDNYDLQTTEGAQAFFAALIQDPLMWVALLVFFLLGILGVVYGFFQQSSLSRLAQDKKIDISNFFSDWRRFFPMIGTNICVGLYYLGYALLFGIIGVILTTVLYFIGRFMDNKIILDLIQGIILAGYIGMMVWLAISFVATTPLFFLEDIRYFEAAKTSKKLIHERWWKTFGSIVLVGLICFLPSIIFNFSVKYLGLLDSQVIASAAISLVSTSLTLIAGMISFSFLLHLVTEYRKEDKKNIATGEATVSEKPIKKIVKKTTKKAKK